MNDQQKHIKCYFDCEWCGRGYRWWTDIHKVDDQTIHCPGCAGHQRTTRLVDRWRTVDTKQYQLDEDLFYKIGFKGGLGWVVHAKILCDHCNHEIPVKDRMYDEETGVVIPFCTLCRVIDNGMVSIKTRPTEKVVDGTPPPLPEKLGATKHNAGKVRMSLLPFDALWEVAKVVTYGESGKPNPDGTFGYGAHNWRKGLPWSEWEDAFLRHYARYQMGENHDAESRIAALAHLACDSLFLLSHYIQGHGIDDRWTGSRRDLEMFDEPGKGEDDA